uniref:uncharacterized protein si:ch73-103b9.2 n=1 Tax=Scatophagus argus TaxID=75038 RepID=UPI001ED7E344|nr:uncharacterized protein si:ch73-103b9.2 [Scatophagus argus]
MATSEEVDLKAVNGSGKFPAQEDVAEELPDRKHVDALLDLSEEDFLKELEPYEYRCYSGWEEAVHGWARVAPLSCILLSQKSSRKLKHKEVDNPVPLSVPNADSSASIAEHCWDSHTALHNGFKKQTLNQHAGSCSNTPLSVLRKDASEWPLLIAMRKTTPNLVLVEKIEEGGALRQTPLQNRAIKPQKHSHRPSNTVVPIKNFTFLPPIESPQMNPQRISGQLCNGKKAPEGETTEENCVTFNKKSGTRGTKMDPVVNPEPPMHSAGLTRGLRTCQHNPLLFSAVRVSITKRCQVPVSSKCDTATSTGFSVDKSLTQALHPVTAAGAEAHMHPSKTVCAVKLYEGCEINV